MRQMCSLPRKPDSCTVVILRPRYGVETRGRMGVQKTEGISGFQISYPFERQQARSLRDDSVVHLEPAEPNQTTATQLQHRPLSTCCPRQICRIHCRTATSQAKNTAAESNMAPPSFECLPNKLGEKHILVPTFSADFRFSP